jgi:ribonuclease P protein component
MLPKKNRLPSFLILKLLEKGKHFPGRHLSLYISKVSFFDKETKKAKKDNEKFSYFAFLVPKRVSKKAVEKNKLKKRMKAVVKENLSSIKQGFNVLFLARKNFIGEDFNAIKSEMEKLLKKADLL